jgi:MFS family permease
VSSREPEETTRRRPEGVRASVSLLRRNRDFRRLYLASLISLGGDWFLLVALMGLVLEVTGSAVWVGLLIAAQEVPFFLMSFVGGVLADRLDRRRLMIIADVARAVLCLGFLFTGDEGTIWLAFVLLALISSFSAAFDPASSAALPNLVDDEDLGPANALIGSAWGTMLAIGAAIGGVVAASLGRDTAFLIDGVTFAVSGALIAGIRRPFSRVRDPDTEQPGIVAATVETARYARRDHRVLALLGVKAGFGIGAGVLVLISVFAEKEFHAGEVGIGILMAFRGVGALIGPFFARRIAGPDDRRLFGTIGGALAVFGLGYALLSLAPGLAVAAVLVMIAHLGGGAQWMLSTYGLQRIVPDRILGRVFAFDYALITLTLTISSLVTGWTAETWDAPLTALALGGVSLVWAGVWSLLTTDVRRAARHEALRPDRHDAAGEAQPTR